jgi:hypothetical protein
MLAAAGSEAIRAVNETLGILSPFSRENGYFADALGLATVVLPPGWQERLLPLKDEDGQVVALCLETHDVAVSKLMAGRDKDFPFIIALLERRLIALPALVERAALIQQTASAGALLPRLKKLSERLRPLCSHAELQPLADLISRLSSQA